MRPGGQAVHSSPRPMRSLFLVVSHAVHRDALTTALRAAGFAVTATVADGGGTIAAIGDGAGDVLLLDLPAFEGLPLLRALRCQHSSGRAVVLAHLGEEAELPRWVHEGAMGLVLPSESIHDLVTAIETVAAGATRYPAAVLAACLAHGHALGEDSTFRTLTDREQEIVSLIDRGCSNQEIATALGIRLSTVKNHVHHVLEKLHARGRSAAAAQVAGRRRRI
jgi:two-component system, NarL family, nitrate/nitrite response regulator NarL